VYIVFVKFVVPNWGATPVPPPQPLQPPFKKQQIDFNQEGQVRQIIDLVDNPLPIISNVPIKPSPPPVESFVPKMFQSSDCLIFFNFFNFF
jgi:hypothetical protein